MNPSISTVSSFATTSCIFEAVQQHQRFSAAVWKKDICKYCKKVPFLVNIERCPKFLEYALSTSNFLSVSGSLTEKLIICSWLHCFGNPIVWFLIKPGDQTDETESPNLVRKAGVAKRWLPNLFFVFIKFFLLTQHLGLRLRNKCEFFLSFFFILCIFFVFFWFVRLHFLFRIFLLGFVICNCKWGKLRTHFWWLLIRLVKSNGLFFPEKIQRRDRAGRVRTWNFPGYWRKRMWKFQESIKKVENVITPPSWKNSPLQTDSSHQMLIPLLKNSFHVTT